MWPGGPWLTSDAYKAWAGIGELDTADDVAIQVAVDAAQQAIQIRAPKGFTTDDGGQPLPVPAMLIEAGLLLTNRLMARRNSPDGVVGVSDMGTATVLSYDTDINQNIGPWSEPVVA